MKTITIGDIHGKDVWKRIDILKYDKIIFVGDYVDSKSVSDQKIIENLLAIINLKIAYQEKVELLLGNHDIQYLFYPLFNCSGFNSELSEPLQCIFKSNILLFNVAFQYNDVLWTHAGVSKLWISENKLDSLLEKEKIGITLNSLFYNNHLELLFQAGPKRKGKFNVGGPLWADKTELTKDLVYSEINQIAGHNRCDKISKKEIDDHWYVNCNCLDEKNEFFEYEFKLKIPRESGIVGGE